MYTKDKYVKPRVFILTDIENEPDDAMSLVRYLTYSNQFDTEGIVATTSIHLQDKTAKWRVLDIINAYGEVRDNLEKHEKGYPSAESLLDIAKEGLPLYGLNGVGEGKESEGSRLLIEAVDKDDDRPVWVLVWGGPSVLAQALWTVKKTRSEKELAHFVSKLRVYTISDQDDSGPWMRKNFPDLFYIVSPGFFKGGAYHFATWSGISGDKFHGRFSGADFDIVSNPWLARNIQSKGPLGEQYPSAKFLMEGDTPTYLYLINNGLSVPEHPEWGSWGGRYEYYIPRMKKWFQEPETRPIYSDAEDEVLGVDGNWYTTNKATIWRWRKAFQNDFAARMDWTVKSYENANHPPVPKLNHPDYIEAKQGDRIDLSAEGSYDPDGDELEYHWFFYNEAGTFTTQQAVTGVHLKIEDYDKKEAWFIVPTERVMKTGTMHIILSVTDTGSPSLTRYRRVIINVTD